MSSITAAMVKSLRERTGAGMMDCKKALAEVDGDMDAAADYLRKAGAASADKKAGRVAAEGVVATATGDNGQRAAIIEVNSETDFVAKEPSFIAFANDLAALVLKDQPADVEALAALSMGGVSVDEARRELIAKIGENISVRRFEILTSQDGAVHSYLHQGGRIGVVISLSGGTAETGRDVAMHIAATNPGGIDEQDLAPEVLTQEKNIFLAQAEQSGKPADIAEKMVTGRMKKFIKENTLLGQDFVKNPDITVAQHLSSANATVTRYARFEVGEGIAKKEDDFVAEVMAQAGMASE